LPASAVGFARRARPSCSSSVLSTSDVAHLRAAVSESPLPIGLVALRSPFLMEMSPAAIASTSLGVAANPTIDLEHVTAAPGLIGQTLALLAAGVLDGCKIRTTAFVPGSDEHISLSLRAIGRDPDQSYAIAVVCVAGTAGHGAVEHDGLVFEMTLEHVIGALLDRVELGAVAALLRRLEASCPTDGRGALGARALDPRRAEPPRGASVSTESLDARTGRRLAELEQRIRRIAQEVDATGVVSPRGGARAEEVPELDDITARQGEILARLLRGDRVPTISREMHLASSTVRNHLTTLYRKVGVHSQVQLIERMNASSGS
jgi:DNA-binding CsgD family transcriptional regulator